MTVPRRSGFALYIGGVAMVVLVAGLALRLRGQRRISETATVPAPTVAVVTAQPAPATRTITLVGEATPYLSATLYAKVSGYLKEIRVDKGDSVRADQVLAVIESPELDHQYEAAVADAWNKQLNAQRAATLVKRDLISQQEADQAEADARVARQTVAALATQKGYEILRAPFDGVVTARYADPGALVQNATGSQTSALPVVTVARVDRLRVFVYPDQSEAYAVRVGTPVEISVPGQPDLRLNARVTRTSGQLDPRTRTLLTEIDFDNHDRRILPGSFVLVTLRLPEPRRAGVELPAETLVLRNGQPFVAVVESDGRLHFRPVRLGSDDGVHVQVLEGVRPGDRVVLNPGESLADGARVQPVPSLP
jgi:RND family efflux transporter MFP subunit